MHAVSYVASYMYLNEVNILSFRTVSPPVLASSIFSLQMDPIPNVVALEENPIIMMFDVVSYWSSYKHITHMHTTATTSSLYLIIRGRK